MSTPTSKKSTGAASAQAKGLAGSAASASDRNRFLEPHSTEESTESSASAAAPCTHRDPTTDTRQSDSQPKSADLPASPPTVRGCNHDGLLSGDWCASCGMPPWDVAHPRPVPQSCRFLELHSTEESTESTLSERLRAPTMRLGALSPQSLPASPAPSSAATTPMDY